MAGGMGTCGQGSERRKMLPREFHSPHQHSSQGHTGVPRPPVIWGLMEQVLEGQTEELAECITVENLEELSRLGRRLRRLQYMLCIRGPNTLHCPEHY